MSDGPKPQKSKGRKRGRPRRKPENIMASQLKYSTGHVNIPEVYQQLSKVGGYPTLATLLTMDDDTEDVKEEIKIGEKRIARKAILARLPDSDEDKDDE